MITSVIVTGASGFIARNLIFRLRQNTRFSVIGTSRSVGPFTDVQVKDYRETPSGDILIHLGEESERARVNRYGDSDLKKSKAITEELLGKNYQYAVYASSYAVYGEHSETPFDENSAIHLRDNYTRTKIDSEEKFIENAGAVIRLSNVIGPGMSDKNVLSDILTQLKDDGPITVRNDKPVRDFIWVDDVCTALEQMIFYRPKGIYNLGSGRGISVQELALTVLRQTGQQEREIHSLQSETETTICVLDTTKLKKRLAWGALTSINDAARMLAVATLEGLKES
jgi:UDP-glucose 4-epimerase